MKGIDILCVDDNEDYCFLLQRALEKACNTAMIEVLKDGQTALDHLKTTTNVTPRLILLDIDLPDVNGMEILKCIKESNRLRQIPVIIVSTSENPRDINHALDLGANAYVAKPSSFRKLASFLQDTCNFWLNHPIISSNMLARD